MRSNILQNIVLTTAITISSMLTTGCSSNDPVPNAKPETPIPKAITEKPQTPEKKTVDKTPPAAPVDPKVVKLRAAFANNNADIRKLIAMRDELDDFQISVGDENFKWNKLEIPKLAIPSTDDQPPLKNALVPSNLIRRFNAFRFRSPFKVTAVFQWVHGLTDQPGWWDINPTHPPKGFFLLPTYANQLMPNFRDWNLTFPEVPLANGSQFVFQEGILHPGEEFYLTYSLPDDASGVVYAGMRLTPLTNNVAGAKSAREIADRAGITLKTNPFPQTTAGRQAAFDLAERYAKSENTDRKAVWRALESVWEMIPEIQLTNEQGKPAWNRIVPDTPFQFHAVRFRSTFDHPVDLSSCIISDRNQIHHGLLSRSGEVKPWTRDWLEVDLPIPEGNHPKENFTNLSELHGGQILPGQEYLIWFAAFRKTMPDFDLAVHLSPANSLQSTTRNNASAMVFGLTLPQEVTDQRSKKALDICKLIAHDGASVRTMEFDRLIQFAAPTLPVLKMSSEEVEWTRCEVKDSVAYRLEDNSRDGNLVVAVVNAPARKSDWGVVGVDAPGLQRGFRISNPASQAMVPQSAGDFLETAIYSAEEKTIPRQKVLYCYLNPNQQPISIRLAARANVPGKRSDLVQQNALMEAMGIRHANSRKGELIGKHDRQILGMTFLSDASLATTSVDRTIRLWNLNEKKPVPEIQSSAVPVTALAYSAEGNLLACATCADSRTAQSTQLAIHDAKTLKQQTRLSIPENHCPLSIAFSNDGQSVISCDPGDRSRPSSICVWKISDAAVPRMITFEDQTKMRSANWLQDLKSIVVSGGKSWKDPTPGIVNTLHSNEIRILDSDSLEVKQTLSEPGDEWVAHSISADGKRMAFLSDMGFIKVVNTETMDIVGKQLHGIWGTQIQLSADGSRLVSNTREGEILIWDINRDVVISQWGESKPKITSVAIAPSGKMVALGAENEVRSFAIDDASIPVIPRKVNSLKMEFSPIPPGEFNRQAGGAAKSRLVKMTKPFHMGIHEVTVGQFRAFINATGYRTTAESSGKGGVHRLPGKKPDFNPDWNWKNPGFDQDDRHPVVQVTWHDAVAFCEWLSKHEGKTYRLPTEAEWEYASLSGSTKNWFWGSNEVHTTRCANVADQEFQKLYGKVKSSISSSDGYIFTAPVGSYFHSSLGLYDMHGNVQEWCSDWFDPVYYTAAPEEDPTGPAKGTKRVQRGGSFASPHYDTSCNRRYDELPETMSSTSGFRVVLQDD